jgi:hypothetical protein
MTIIIDTNGKQFVPKPYENHNRVQPIDSESKDNKYKNNKEQNREPNKHNPKRLVDRYV